MRCTSLMKIFVPFCESLVDELGLNLGELVPFKLDYECLRVGEAFPADDDAVRLGVESPGD